MAEYEAGTVEVNIESTSDGAEGSLKALIASVKEATKQLSNMIPVFEKINSLSSALKEIETLNFSNLGTQLSQLQNVSKPINSFVNSIKKFSEIDLQATTINSIQGITSISTALQGINVESITNVATGIKSIATATAKLQAVDFSNFTSNLKIVSTSVKAFVNDFSKAWYDFSSKNFDLSFLKEISKALSDIAKLNKLADIDTSKITSVFSTLTTQITPFLAKLKEASAELQYLSNITNKLNAFEKADKKAKSTITSKTSKGFLSNFNIGKIYFLLNYTKRITDAIAKSISSAAAYQETVNLFQVSMGEYTNEATRFANKLSEAFGLALPNLMKYQATFNNLLTSIGGIGRGTAYKLSEVLTTMSLDYASLFNVSIESAMTKFQSALTLKASPIRADSGFDVTQNTLQGYLADFGMADKSVRSLTQIEKRLLTIYGLMKQMKNVSATGDFSRTIESTTNQLKILKEQLSEVGRWIGSIVVVYFAPILPVLNGIVMAVKEAIKTFALLAGYELPKTNFKDIFNTEYEQEELDKLEKGIKDVQNATLGIDELNVISPPSETGTGTGTGTGTDGVDPLLASKILEEYQNSMDLVSTKAGEIRDKIMEWLGYTKDVNEETGEITWVLGEGANILQTIADVLLSIIIATLLWKAIWKTIDFVTSKNGVADLFKNLKNLFEPLITIAGFALLIYGFLDAWKEGLSWESLVLMIGGITLATLGLWNAFGKVGVAIALIIGGIALIVAGFKDAFANGTTVKNFLAIAAGILAISVAVWILSGSIWAGLITGGILLAIAVIYLFWEQIVGVGNGILQFLKNLWADIKDGFESLGDVIEIVWLGIKNALDFVISAMAKGLKWLLDFINGIVEKIGKNPLAEKLGIKKIDTKGLDDYVKTLDDTIEATKKRKDEIWNNAVERTNKGKERWKEGWWTDAYNQGASIGKSQKEKVNEAILGLFTGGKSEEDEGALKKGVNALMKGFSIETPTGSEDQKKKATQKKETDDWQKTLKETFGQGNSDIQKSLNKSTEDIKNQLSEKKEEDKKQQEELSSTLSEKIVDVGDIMKTSSASTETSIVQEIQTAWRNIVEAINSLKANMQISVNGEKVEVPTFATGGFPQRGAFIMNEGSSAEMLGTINGKTAVVNNEQIINAVSSGVESANEPVVQAIYVMAQQIVNAVEENATNVSIGDETITRANRRGEAKLGVQVIKGGAFSNA